MSPPGLMAADIEISGRSAGFQACALEKVITFCCTLGGDGRRVGRMV
jgi:hypothetical protein